MPRLTTVARRDDVADLAVVQAFAHLPHGRTIDAERDSVDGWDPLSSEGPHRSMWYLTGYRFVGGVGNRAVYVFRFTVNHVVHPGAAGSSTWAAATVDAHRGAMVTLHAYDYQPASERTRAGAEEKAAAVLAGLATPCAQCGGPKGSSRHTTDPNRAGHAFVEQAAPDVVPADDQLTVEEIADNVRRTSGAEQIAASIAAARAEVTEPAAWGEDDPEAPHACERCSGRFTEDDQGADVAAGLCPSCSASNADRVTL